MSNMFPFNTVIRNKKVNLSYKISNVKLGYKFSNGYETDEATLIPNSYSNMSTNDFMNNYNGST